LVQRNGKQAASRKGHSRPIWYLHYTNDHPPRRKCIMPWRQTSWTTSNSH